jgi:REP element-mobilizing transposase RayT
LFGEIKNGEMVLNECGKTVMKCWDDLPNHYNHAQLDEFVIMPNHIHGIVSLSNVGAQFIAPFRKTTTAKQGVINIAPTENNATKQDVVNHAPTVGEIVRAFKARCTHAIRKIRTRKERASLKWGRNLEMVYDRSDLSDSSDPYGIKSASPEIAARGQIVDKHRNVSQTSLTRLTI